jgi:hypothetical protein
MSFSSIVSVVSNTFSALVPVPAFLAKLSTLQSLVGFAGWTSALVAFVIAYRYIAVRIFYFILQSHS